MQTTNSPGDRDPNLWKIAKKRASFKKNLITYLIVNAFMWAIWYFTYGRNHNDNWPWPIWASLGWGIGLLFHFFGAYVYPDANSTEREYERLKKKNQQ